MNREELKNRTKSFALRIVKLVSALPENREGRTIANQLIRCGTAVGANYRAACRARTTKEWIAKIGIVEEEADECAYWLELIETLGLLPATRTQAIWDEANQITAIMAAAYMTSRRQVADKKPRTTVGQL